jgi:NAD(P)-dependent dehydrogenase (short-subunit alcohol dehydrogenase family)
VLVNNAGVAWTGSEVSDPVSALRVMLAVHLEGTLGAIDAALPGMLERQWGRVVNTVSEIAFDTRLGAGGAYAIAKAAVWAATRDRAARVEGRGVTVNAIAPRARTRMNEALFAEGDAEPDLDPDAAARLVEFLVSDAAADTNGRVIFVTPRTVREYDVARSADTALARRLAAALDLNGPRPR